MHLTGAHTMTSAGWMTQKLAVRTATAPPADGRIVLSKARGGAPRPMSDAPARGADAPAARARRAAAPDVRPPRAGCAIHG